MKARQLKSNTNQSSNSWPLKTLATQLAIDNEQHKSVIDFTYEYGHATSDDETITLTGSSSVDHYLVSFGSFHGINVLGDSFHNK